jgi:hypothetical protein
MDLHDHPPPCTSPKYEESVVYIRKFQVGTGTTHFIQGLFFEPIISCQVRQEPPGVPRIRHGRTKLWAFVVLGHT